MKNALLSAIFILSLNHRCWANQPRAVARAVVGSSLAAAKQDASYFVMQDLEAVLMTLLQEGQLGSQGNITPLDIAPYMRHLEEEALRLSNAGARSSEMVAAQVRAQWDAYNRLVRERVGISFQIQDRIRHSDQIFRNMKGALDSFSSVCRTGRSARGLDYVVAPIPHTPGPEFAISISGQYNGQLSFDVNINSYSGTPEDKNRLILGQILYTATSINSTIAYSGATGAAVAKAAAINPYLLGAVIIYGIVTHVMAAEDHARLLNEITAANIYMLEKTATANDVATYYRESCATVLPVVQKIRETLEALQSSAEERQRLAEKAQQSSEERKIFSAESESMARTREWLYLYHSAQAEKCLNQNKQEKKETAVCRYDNGVYQSLRDQSLTIAGDLASFEAESREKTKSIQEFSSRYPIEKRAHFVSDTLVDILASEWENTESHWLQFSFEASDALMQNAFQRLLLVLGQYRLETHKNWFFEKNAVFADERKAQEFETLKREYRELVAEGIRVVFARTDRLKFQSRTETFLKRANAFVKTAYSQGAVIKFQSLLGHFKQIYKKL